MNPIIDNSRRGTTRTHTVKGGGKEENSIDLWKNRCSTLDNPWKLGIIELDEWPLLCSGPAVSLPASGGVFSFLAPWLCYNDASAYRMRMATGYDLSIPLVLHESFLLALARSHCSVKSARLVAGSRRRSPCRRPGGNRRRRSSMVRRAVAWRQRFGSIGRRHVGGVARPRR